MTTGRRRPQLPKMLYLPLPAANSASIRQLKPRARTNIVSDPNHPVPFVGYTTDTVPQRYMVDDQRFASYRPDVLTL